jgi:hypothetical protein
MHFLPGGLCTAWERGPYVFDGCIHYLFGSGPGQPASPSTACGRSWAPSKSGASSTTRS